MADEDYGENVTVRFPRWVLDKIDAIITTSGLSRSDYIRLGVLEKLANGSHLTPDQKKALGIQIEERP